MFFLRVKELERPDFVKRGWDKEWVSVSYRTWFGEAQVNIGRKFVKGGWIKVSAPEEQPWGDCVLVTIFGLSKGSYRFQAWVKQEDLSEHMHSAPIKSGETERVDANKG